uniref:Uncharacterized protein n=1 Tax=viral metagenome TaxID=1070528 RepID=A0A6M3LIT4_9ZZZZ
MKIRIGFVSNSSSASFIIQNQRDDWNDKDPLLSPNEISKLKKYGFLEVYASHHEQIDNYNRGQDEVKIYKNAQYESGKHLLPDFSYYVSCNEDQVIDFLTQNNIPFSALVNYGCGHMFFEKDSDHITYLCNYGHMVQMRGWKDGKLDQKYLQFNQELIDHIDKFRMPLTDL